MSAEKASKDVTGIVADEFCDDLIYGQESLEVKDTEENKETFEDSEKSDNCLFKVVGKYKDKRAKPWTIVDPVAERVTLWKLLEDNDKAK